MSSGAANESLGALLLREAAPADSDHAAAADSLALEQTLAALVHDAAAPWPQLQLAAPEFIRYLAARLPRGLDVLQALQQVHAADLYLACACARRLPAALAAFEQHCLAPLDAALGRLGLPRATVDEAKQQVRQHLLLGEPPDKPALIGQYSGRGPLRAWVRITATRAALRLRRGSGQELPVEDQVLQAVPGTGGNPELDLLKARYRDAVRAAIRQALATLAAREATVLQQHYLDGLTTYEIATHYRVSQATTSRWLARAREAVLQATRQALMSQLAVEPADCDSIMRLMHSNLDLTLRGFLIEK